ncbi:MAG TPA: hypothetical protein VLX91_03980 [Candidatus Acidoferrales bacterium]|nr:hypothetical protein [Candidatus Acidoferrales bacterium]
MRSLTRFINNNRLVLYSLEKTRKFYRQYDPGWYLYRRVASEINMEAKFRDEFIELVYVTLSAWNMNSRRARLAGFDVFKESIHEHRDRFARLSNFCLDGLTSAQLNEILWVDGHALFSNLVLVADTKPRLVTYSKTLHFFLPDLFMPIDRTYTLNYFCGNLNVPRRVEHQFELLCKVLEEARRFAASVPLAHFIDRVWNANVPKTIDNIIIGYQLLNRH